MPSSPSERAVLHWVPGSPWSRDGLARALAEAAPGDWVLLVQDAVPAALAAARLPAAIAQGLERVALAVAKADLDARGLADCALRAIPLDDAAIVALAAACRSSCTWA